MSDQPEQLLDLSKTVEISAEEENKLNQFLQRVNANISGDL